LYDYFQHIKIITNIFIEKVVTDTQHKELLVHGSKKLIKVDDVIETQIRKLITCSENFIPLIDDQNFNRLIDGLIYYLKDNDGYLFLSNNPDKLNQLSSYRIIYMNHLWAVQYGQDLIYYLGDTKGIKIIASLLRLPIGEYGTSQIIYMSLGEKITLKEALLPKSSNDSQSKSNIKRNQGINKLSDLLKGKTNTPSTILMDEIWESLKQFRGKAEQNDDMTMVLVKVS